MQVDADPDAIAAAARRDDVVRAPATSANIGAGFDTAAVAFDLWNELEVTDGAGVVIEGEGAVELAGRRHEPRRPRVRACSPTRRASDSASSTGFRSSAGSARRPPRSHSASSRPRPTRRAEELLAAGLTLEPHADNLAAALLGGLTLAWDGRIARIAESLPLDADRGHPPRANVDRDLAADAARDRPARRGGGERRPGGSARRRRGER